MTTTTLPTAGQRTALAWDRISLACLTVWAGLFAGFFVAYEVSVLAGFAVVDDTTYVTVFQAVNATIRNFWFGLIFFGTLPIALAALLTNRGHRLTRLFLGFALAAFVAVFLITFVGNVPMNEDLAGINVVDAGHAAQVRADFEGPWNRLNTIRTLIAVVGFAGIAVASQLQPEGRRR